MAEPAPPTDLPGLVLELGEDPLRRWSQAVPAGTKQAYVRFPRGLDLPLGAVQRLSRRAHLVVDAQPQDPDDVLDLCVAGAFGIVAWLDGGGDLAQMAEAMGDGFILGCHAKDLERAVAVANDLGCAILLDGPVEDLSPWLALPNPPYGYAASLRPGPMVLRAFGRFPSDAGEAGPEAAGPKDAVAGEA